MQSQANSLKSDWNMESNWNMESKNKITLLFPHWKRIMIKEVGTNGRLFLNVAEWDLRVQEGSRILRIFQSIKDPLAIKSSRGQEVSKSAYIKPSKSLRSFILGFHKEIYKLIFKRAALLWIKIKSKF